MGSRRLLRILSSDAFLSTWPHSRIDHQHLREDGAACTKGHSRLVVGDSLFGSVDTLHSAVQEGYGSVLSCRKDRPAFLFKDFLESETEEGQTSNARGHISRADGTKVPFIASLEKHNGKAICTPSSVESTRVEETEVEEIVRSAEVDTSTIENDTRIRTNVRNIYAKLMDLVDEADAEILSSLPQFRKSHWTSAQMVWVLVTLLVVNGRRLSESANGVTDIRTTPDWIRLLLSDLSGMKATNSLEAKDHSLGRIATGRGMCKACVARPTGHGDNSSVSRTKFACISCGPICKQCRSDGTHELFARKGGRLEGQKDFYRNLVMEDK